jgi:hypothetical protein
MNEAGISPRIEVEDVAVGERVERDVAAESVYYALFRVAELAEYSSPEQAVDWARSVLGDRQLLEGFVDRVRELPATVRMPHAAEPDGPTGS